MGGHHGNFVRFCVQHNVVVSLGQKKEKREEPILLLLQQMQGTVLVQIQWYTQTGSITKYSYTHTMQ